MEIEKAYYTRTEWAWGDDDCLVGIGEVGGPITSYSGDGSVTGTDGPADEGLAIVREDFRGKVFRSKRGALFIGKMSDGRPWQANFILSADADAFQTTLIPLGAEVKRLGI